MTESEAALRRTAFVDDVLHEGSNSPRSVLLRGLLTPASYAYRFGLEAYLLPFRIGLRQRYRVRNAAANPVPTVVIGNLSSGGTGKTPMTQLVAGGLQRAGNRVVILSRGHGGSAEPDDRPRIVGDGFRTLLSAKKAGDEPVLLADSLPGVPVLIGRDRRKSAALAMERFGPDVVILDDALQYWQLHRDVDIVLVDARRPFDNGFLLPRGLLREPPSHLSRAAIVVITRSNLASSEQLKATLRAVRSHAKQAEVFTATHAPVGWIAAAQRTELLPLNSLDGRRVAAFSAIADNKSFRATAAGLGADVVASREFVDHSPYERKDIAALAAEFATIAGVDSVVTTEKDLVKIRGRWPAGAPPLFALRIGMQLSDDAGFFAALEAEIEAVE